MKTSQKQIDWIGFAVNFVFGALVGAGLGFGVFTRSEWASSPSGLPALFMVAGGALILGLVAGVAKDGFWNDVTQTYTDTRWLIVKIAGILLVIALIVLGVIRVLK